MNLGRGYEMYENKDTHQRVRPVPSPAGITKRERIAILEAYGWTVLSRSGAGSCIHHDRPEIATASIAAAFRIAMGTS